MLTEREQALIKILRTDPLVSTEEMARRLGTSREAVRVHLSNLGKKGEILGRGYVLREEATVVVIGGANMDIKAQSVSAATAATSNPGRTTSSSGGVGRNIAENLARLGTQTHLVAAIGTDALGERLLAETRAAGVEVDHVLRSTASTGTYTAVLDNDGELIVAVSDMAAADELSSRWIQASKDLVSRANFLVLDGNLRADAIETALDIATLASVPVLIDPVSDAKATLLAPALDASRPVTILTPNASELAALTDLPTRTDRQLVAAANALHERGVHHVWIRLGRRGSLVSTRLVDEPGPAKTTAVPALSAKVVDVTGAGDAMAASYVHARLDGSSVVDAVRFAHAAATLTIESEHTVRPDLTRAKVTRLMNRSRPSKKSTATRQPAEKQKRS